MKKLIFTAFIFLALINLPDRSFAQGLDQPIVAGGKVRLFEIPARPVGSRYAYEKSKSAITLDAADEYRKEAFTKCPKISDYIFKIFKRLVESNHLETFGEISSPGLALSIRCEYVSPETGRGGAYANSLGIHIPAYVADIMKTEDEVAFIIAHELAHILLGHNELLVDLYKSDPSQDPSIIRIYTPMSSLERDADTYGAIIAVNAGYNPLALKESLCRETKFLDKKFAITPCWTINNQENRSHGSINDRVKLLEEFLRSRQIEYNDSSLGFFSTEGELARKEVRAIRKRKN